MRDPTQPSPRGSYSPFAKTLLAGCRIDFSTGLDRLPYLGKSSAVTRGAFDFCTNLFWFWSFHKIHFLK
jgi:hypothetical protein